MRKQLTRVASGLVVLAALLTAGCGEGKPAMAPGPAPDLKAPPGSEGKIPMGGGGGGAPPGHGPGMPR